MLEMHLCIDHFFGLNNMNKLSRTERTFSKSIGSSLSENKYYVLIMFDISDRKKYFLLTKTLKRYANRIQNSVYEAYLKFAHIKGLIRDVENLMKSEKYFNSADKVRIYKLTGTCSSVIFGEFIEERTDRSVNLFI